MSPLLGALCSFHSLRKPTALHNRCQHQGAPSSLSAALGLGILLKTDTSVRVFIQRSDQTLPCVGHMITGVAEKSMPCLAHYLNGQCGILCHGFIQSRSFWWCQHPGGASAQLGDVIELPRTCSFVASEWHDLSPHHFLHQCCKGRFTGL